MRNTLLRSLMLNATTSGTVELLLPQAAQATGGLGSSCCITQDYKEMYWDFNDLGKSYDLIMKLKINVLYL